MRKTVLGLLFFVSPVALAILFAISAMAREKPPLPPPLLTAKSAYLLNKTGSEGAFSTLYDEFKKWGRWEIVDTPEKADLLISFG